MLGLLTRATRARSLCNCSLCIPNATRIAQRTGHTSLRQRLLRPDAFTVFSSTFVFSAAVVDGMRKDRKLQDWDDLLAKTQAEIDAVEKDQKSRLERLNINAIEKGQASGNTSEDRHSWLSQVTWGDMLEWASLKEQERKRDGFRECKGIPMDLLKNLNDLDLAKVLHDRRISSRFYSGPDCAGLESTPATHVYSAKKLRTLEWSLVKLVSKYLQLISSDGVQERRAPEAITDDVTRLVQSKSVSADDVTDDIQVYDLRLKRLHDEQKDSHIFRTFPSPNSLKYTWSPSERKEDLMTYNEDLHQLLYSFGSLERKDVTSLCKLLLNAKIASDVHTYNLLLVKFCQLQADSFVLATYESFQECHIRPNEITHATLLRYFALTKNTKAFDLYLQRMNGFRQGLAITDPEYHNGPLTSSRYRSFGQKKVKFAELARFNTEVYTCLLKGLIEMSRFDEAVWYFRNMINEGWAPGMELLDVLLKSCCDTADIVSGWHIWKYMHSLCTLEEPVSEESYAVMTELCKKCDKLGLSRWIAQEATSLGHSTDLAIGDSILSTQDVTSESETYVNVVRRALRASFTPRTLQDRYPYVESQIIEKKLSDLWHTWPLAASDYGTDIEKRDSIFKKMTIALQRNSYLDARAYIKRQKLDSNIKEAMRQQARLAFKLLDELAGLNEESQLRSQQLAEKSDQDVILGDVSTTNDPHRKTERWPSLESSVTSRNAMLAEIEEINANVAPEAVVKAYKNFQQTLQQKASAQGHLNRLGSRPQVIHLAAHASSGPRVPMNMEAG